MAANREVFWFIFLGLSLYLASQFFHHQTLCLMKRREEYANNAEEIGSYGSSNPQMERRRFKSGLRTEAEYGEFKVLDRFLKRSDNNRQEIYDADPIVPHHSDAEIVAFVARGEGIISFVHPEKMESFNLERGDTIRVPSGSTLYLINTRNTEKLRVFMFLHPINTPWRFKGYFGAGGLGKEAFPGGFSHETLEADFKVRQPELVEVSIASAGNQKLQQVGFGQVRNVWNNVESDEVFGSQELWDFVAGSEEGGDGRATAPLPSVVDFLEFM